MGRESIRLNSKRLNKYLPLLQIMTAYESQYNYHLLGFYYELNSELKGLYIIWCLRFKKKNLEVLNNSDH